MQFQTLRDVPITLTIPGTTIALSCRASLLVMNTKWFCDQNISEAGECSRNQRNISYYKRPSQKFLPNFSYESTPLTSVNPSAATITNSSTTYVRNDNATYHQTQLDRSSFFPRFSSPYMKILRVSCGGSCCDQGATKSELAVNSNYQHHQLKTLKTLPGIIKCAN